VEFYWHDFVVPITTAVVLGSTSSYIMHSVIQELLDHSYSSAFQFLVSTDCILHWKCLADFCWDSSVVSICCMQSI